MLAYLSLVNRFFQISWLNERTGSIAFLLRFLVYFFLNASVGSLVAISLERMHATFRPLKHSLIKKRCYGVAITAVWLTAGVFSFLFLIFFPLKVCPFSCPVVFL